LEPALNLLANTISDSVMNDLNYRVDYLKQSPEQVAKEFLLRNNLYKEPKGGNKGIIRLGSKIFGEQYILLQMYSMLIKGNTNLAVEAKTGLGGTKICFDALTNGQIDAYPEYTGTGLLVILQPGSKEIQRVMGDKQMVYDFVQQRFLERYGIRWLRPIGFNNAYALMMRRKQAQKLRIETISQLKMYIDNN
jgi:osmoprotectant transport system permease protein